LGLFWKARAAPALLLGARYHTRIVTAVTFCLRDSMPFWLPQEASMSAAIAEQIVVTAKTASVQIENRQADRHPLVPVFVLGAVALATAVTVVGIIMGLLALRPTGFFSPF
jgi:hypothetical protein